MEYFRKEPGMVTLMQMIRELMLFYEKDKGHMDMYDSTAEVVTSTYWQMCW